VFLLFYLCKIDIISSLRGFRRISHQNQQRGVCVCVCVCDGEGEGEREVILIFISFEPGSP
jgi:hypothetical protein